MCLEMEYECYIAEDTRMQSPVLPDTILRASVQFSPSDFTLCDRFLNHSPKLEMTLDTSSIASSSRTRPVRRIDCGVPGIPDGRTDDGGPYTLGNEGAVAEVGLELGPVSPTEFVGESGATKREDSVMRDREAVKSRDCARFCSDRGLPSCSFNFASRRESEPRLAASSTCRVREGMPEPCDMSSTTCDIER